MIHDLLVHSLFWQRSPELLRFLHHSDWHHLRRSTLNIIESPRSSWLIQPGWDLSALLEVEELLKVRVMESCCDCDECDFTSLKSCFRTGEASHRANSLGQRNLKKSQEIQHVNICEPCDIIITIHHPTGMSRDLQGSHLPTFCRGMGSDCGWFFGRTRWAFGAGRAGRAEAVRGNSRRHTTRIDYASTLMWMSWESWVMTCHD